MAWINQISLLIGIWVAIHGINSWRREHVGKRRLELAEDTLSLFYEASDAIKYLRHPMSFSHETEDVERQPDESEGEFKARRNAFVVLHRYNKHQALFNRLHASRYRFMAQIGKEKSAPFDDIREIINEILASARILARLWARGHFQSDEQKIQHRALLDKYEGIFWEGMIDNDPITPRLESAISNMEEICQSVIENKGSLSNFWGKSRLNRKKNMQ